MDFKGDAGGLPSWEVVGSGVGMTELLFWKDHRTTGGPTDVCQRQARSGFLENSFANMKHACSLEHIPMTAPFVFFIRPLSLEKGFELECEGILLEPLRVQRLIEAVIAAVQIGQGLDAEVHILNTEGQVIEVLNVDGSRMLEPIAA
jgi:hypothetical protein